MTQNFISRGYAFGKSLMCSRITWAKNFRTVGLRCFPLPLCALRFAKLQNRFEIMVVFS